jgi:hypothetical protein
MILGGCCFRRRWVYSITTDERWAACVGLEDLGTVVWSLRVSVSGAAAVGDLLSGMLPGRVSTD